MATIEIKFNLAEIGQHSFNSQLVLIHDPRMTNYNTPPPRPIYDNNKESIRAFFFRHASYNQALSIKRSLTVSSKYR